MFFFTTHTITSLVKKNIISRAFFSTAYNPEYGNMRNLAMRKEAKVPGNDGVADLYTVGSMKHMAPERKRRLISAAEVNSKI